MPIQCSSCGTSHPKESDNCPECQPAAAAVSPPGVEPQQQKATGAKPKSDRSRRSAQKAPSGSTLIEFPGGGRVPQWRKELSERVREVQKRRALEGAVEAPDIDTPKKQPSRSAEPAPLGLVPPPSAPSINPLVMKALLRIERAHRAPAPVAPRFSRGGPVLARVPEETAEGDPLPESFAPESIVSTLSESGTMAPEKTDRSQREHGFAVVPPQSNREEVSAAKKLKKVGLITDGVEEAALSYLENLPTATTVFGTSRDDRAGFASRIVAAAIDLTVVAFASCPFAAAIELWGGDWNDLRVQGLMSGIGIAVTFLYLTISTALTGRTLGMRLFGIRAVDVRTGLMPSGSQSARRALGFILSLATAGLGILYGLVDPEHRTAHDHFSGTIVVHD